MQNQNNFNRQGSNYYPQQPNYPQQGSNPPPQYQPNQMSNYQPNQGQPPQYPQQPPNQMSQSPYGQQPPYGQQSQPPYGQPNCPPPYGQQPPYGQSPYPNQGMNSRDPNYTDIPNFRLIGRGKGIDEKEYYAITHSAADALNAKEDPLSNGIIKKIKSQIGGEWMVFASVEGLKGYDFSLSIVTGNDFLSFTIQNFRFQVCRLRD